MKIINLLLIVASFFDPTKKTQFANEKIYGKETVDAKEMLQMYQSLYDVISSLFTEYNIRLKKESIVPSSQSNQTSSSSGHYHVTGMSNSF